MSSKHRALLAAKRHVLNSAHSENEEIMLSDDETESENVHSFALLSDSDDSSTSDSDSDPSVSPRIGTPKRNADCSLESPKRDKTTHYSPITDISVDDISFLDNAIDENLKYKENDKDSRENCTDIFLAVNSKWLDVDDVMRRRFGGHNVGGEDESNTESRKRNQSRGQKLHHKATSIHNRRHVFGRAKEDWPRPVTFVCGGMTIKESLPPPGVVTPQATSWFQYQWSEEYTRLQQSFEVIRNTGDVNMLALFLARHPHHLEATVQLAMVFARTGHMDRASDLIRRCLYYLESTHTDAFHPYISLEMGAGDDMDESRGKRVAAGARCRMDCDRRENRVLFTVLFRHMQMVSMLGCPSVAADVGRCLLSLDPRRDPMHTLLFLDHFLLLGGREEEIEGFCTLAAAEVLCLPHRGTHFASLRDNEGSEGENGDKDRLLLDEVLPMWALSRSLAKMLQETKHRREGVVGVWSTTGRKLCGEEGPSPQQSGSAEMLRDSLERFPHMLSFIVSASSHVPTSASSSGGGRGWLIGGIVAEDVQRQSGMFRNWQQILDHSYFRHFSTPARLRNLFGEKQGNLLSHLGEAFQIRSVGDGSNVAAVNSLWLWRRDDVLEWLFRGCVSLLEGMSDNSRLHEAIAKAETHLRLITSRPRGDWLHQYMSCQLEDFLSEYPRLPPDADPLDPQLADPRMLAGQMQLPQQAIDALNGLIRPRRGGRGAGAGLLEELWTPGGAIERAVWGGEVNEEAVRTELRLLGERGAAVDVDPDAFVAQLQALNSTRRPGRGNLDPALPLMQLFLATLMPWNELDTSRGF